MCKKTQRERERKRGKDRERNKDEILEQNRWNTRVQNEFKCLLFDSDVFQYFWRRKRKREGKW